jgi:trehalose 2-sulfotransferase
MDNHADQNPLVLNAFEFNEPRFDAPANSVTTKVFLCSNQRTGSFLLCRALTHHGLGVPHEYFNTAHIGLLGPRFGLGELSDGNRASSDAGLRGAYIDRLLAHRTVSGVFAAKVQWWEYERYLDNAEGHALLNGGHFIFLFREDMLAQAISFHVAMETGRWGLDGRVTSNASPAPRFFDAGLLEARLNQMADADKSWRLFFAKNGLSPLMLSYEQTSADLPGALRMIAAMVGVPPDRVDPPYREDRVVAPVVSPPASEIRERFLAQSRALR